MANGRDVGDSRMAGFRLPIIEADERSQRVDPASFYLLAVNKAPAIVSSTLLRESDFPMTNQFETLGDVSADIEADTERKLPHEVREVLLDVILAWANLDMVTGFFVALTSGLNPDEGADRFGRKEIADKLKRASKALRENGKEEVASMVCQIADEYPDKSLLRRRIAHSKCVGVRKSNPSCLIFLPFEREGPPGNLAVELIPLSKFDGAVKWAKQAHDYLMQHVVDADYFE
jgi:hypothetical protein